MVKSVPGKLMDKILLKKVFFEFSIYDTTLNRFDHQRVFKLAMSAKTDAFLCL